MYRLVFCDLDGTVATYDHQVRPAVREAMKAVVDTGAWVNISTGRGFQTLLPFLDHVVVNAPVICCNGGLIVEPGARQVLGVHPMPLPLAYDIMRFALQEGLQTWVYLDDLATMLEYRSGDSTFMLRRDGVTLRAVPNPFAELTRPPHKAVIFTESPQLTASLVERVQRYVGDRARILASSPRIIEIIPPGISKAGALAWVAAHLGVPREQTMAIGDGDNDVEMLEWAGLGVAMGNAVPAVKAVADWIAPPVDQDGAAVALRRFVLGSE